jgi:hypothetical protein
MQRIIDFL